jgi:hypothetical protein
MDADAVEARVLATGSEGRHIGQGAADRNTESDAEPRHRTNSFIPSWRRGAS